MTKCSLNKCSVFRVISCRRHLSIDDNFSQLSIDNVSQFQPEESTAFATAIISNLPLFVLNGLLSRFSTSEYCRAKRLFPFVLELSAETKWNELG